MADKLKTNYLDGDDFTPKDINATNEAVNKNAQEIEDVKNMVNSALNGDF